MKNADQLCEILKKIITNEAIPYVPAIKGTIFSVTLEIYLIPPMNTIPTNIARITPIMTPVAPP